MNTSRIIILLLLCSSSIFWSCEKEGSLNEPWLGNWRLTDVSGGVSGQGYTPDFNILHLSADHKFELRSENAIIEKGSFETYLKDGSTQIQFKADTSTNVDLFTLIDKKLMLEEDNLYLEEPCCDLFSYSFTKIQ